MLGSVPRALPPAIQVMNPPVSQDPTRSPMQYSPPYGPQTAIVTIHLWFPIELHRRHVPEVAKPGQSNATHCSGKESVRKRQTVPMALSPYLQVMSLPVTQGPTCLKMRICPYYGPKKAITSTNPHCPQSLWHRCLEVLRRRRRDPVRMKCSDSNAISKAKPNNLLVFVLDPSKQAYSPGMVTRESGHHRRPE
jgi:hypothetical protein